MKQAPYTHYTKPTNTPISSSIPRRKSEMKENLAGGFAFKVSDWIALKRWLLTGSQSNAYYQNKSELTELNVEVLEKCVTMDPEKVASEIIYATNYGINNHTPILALVYLSKGNFLAKKHFKNIFSKVIRTASHLYEFMHYTKQLRGMGQIIHKVIKGWIYDKKISDLEYQFLKYQNRYGWTGRDVLRTIKPKPHDTSQDKLFQWMVDKGFNEYEYLPRISAYEKMKAGNITENDVLYLIDKYSLTHEMIPANIKRTKNIWDALYQKMPVGATIRNLGNLTEKGIMDIQNINTLEKRLSKENLKRGRIHPLGLASAYTVYINGGSLGKGKLYWKTVPRINDIFEQAIEDAFECLEPTEKQYYLALDISGSMWGMCEIGYVGNLWMYPGEVAGIMALATIKAEKNYFIGCFSEQFSELPNVRKSMSFREIIDVMKEQRMGGTNASSAYRYAINNKIYTDVFVMYTDNQSWLGGHPSQTLTEYREKVNPNVKAVYVTLIPYGDAITLVDPNDDKSHDIAGFSSETVKLIQMIAGGSV